MSLQISLPSAMLATSAVALGSFALGRLWTLRASRQASQFQMKSELVQCNETTVHLRLAKEEDMARVHELVCQLADFEKELDSVRTTAETLKRDGFPSLPISPQFGVIVAQDESTGDIVGFALFHLVYSTWDATCAYLEDFYVRPEFRGAGLAKAILQSLTKLALAQGCQRLTWQAYDWNERAIAFYERKVGAKKLSEWLTFRLDREAMDKFLN